MKNTKIITAALFLMTLFFTVSCSENDDEIVQQQALSDEEIVTLVETSLQKSTAGFDSEIEELSQRSIDEFTIDLDCGTIYQDSFERNYNGATVTASYDVDWTYQMACNNIGIPQSLSFSSSSTGTYSTETITSTDISTSSLELVGLQPTSDVLTLSGSFDREGSQELSVLQNRQINTALKIDFMDVVISKELNQVQSGNATIELTGIVTGGQSFSFTGDIVFTGNRTATLTINGNEYQIDLN